MKRILFFIAVALATLQMSAADVTASQAQAAANYANGDLAKGNVEKVTLLESLYPNPVMLPAIEEYININKFRADWTHDTDMANVLSYNNMFLRDG